MNIRDLNGRKTPPCSKGIKTANKIHRHYTRGRKTPPCSKGIKTQTVLEKLHTQDVERPRPVPKGLKHLPLF
ncbi:Uncharacterised protein [Aggregatibacter segnis ATCC 33393]|nr:Uncharacterised protein [Aggregatibacter segnis ATCC 33393]